jgi:hypothetical protein
MALFHSFNGTNTRHKWISNLDFVVKFSGEICGGASLYFTAMFMRPIHEFHSMSAAGAGCLICLKDGCVPAEQYRARKAPPETVRTAMLFRAVEYEDT